MEDIVRKRSSPDFLFDPDEVGVYMNVSPLMLAAHAGQREVAERLLALGADPNFPNEHGYTAFLVAAEEVQLPVIEVLLAKGVDPSRTISDGQGWPHLLHAPRRAEKDDEEAAIVRAIARAKVSLAKLPATPVGDRFRLKDDQKRFPLWKGVQGIPLLHYLTHSRPKCLQAYLELGAPVDERDATGATTLMYALASSFPSRPSIRVLLAAGADVHATDAQGRGLADAALALRRAGAAHPDQRACTDLTHPLCAALAPSALELITAISAPDITTVAQRLEVFDRVAAMQTAREERERAAVQQADQAARDRAQREFDEAAERERKKRRAGLDGPASSGTAGGPSSPSLADMVARTVEQMKQEGATLVRSKEGTSADRNLLELALVASPGDYTVVLLVQARGLKTQLWVKGGGGQINETTAEGWMLDLIKLRHAGGDLEIRGGAISDTMVPSALLLFSR